MNNRQGIPIKGDIQKILPLSNADLTFSQYSAHTIGVESDSTHFG